MGAPARADGRHRAGVRPARDADLAPAGEAHEIGPMFRYDRPQAGRYRQFWQFDVEAIGDPGPAVDAEIVELGVRASTARSGVDERQGAAELDRRPGLPARLHRGAHGLLPRLCRRAATHSSATGSSGTPLRLLDSKDPAMARAQCRKRRASPTGCATRARDHFEAVRAHLDALGVAYRLESGLVRGLDYYTRTAFEFYVDGREGQQQALGGGGRYDGLVELLGGRPTPGIGFGVGLDRLLLALEEQAPDDAAFAGDAPTAVVVGADPAATAHRLRIATMLREAGIAARAELGQRKLGKQLEAAARDQRAFRDHRRR